MKGNGMFLQRLKEYLKFVKSLILTNGRLLRGMWTLTKLPQPAITVFGGSRISSKSPYAKKASALSKKLASHGYSIITGGGSGIMEAANFGAWAATKEDKENNHTKRLKMTSMGIGLLWLSESKEQVNPYVQDRIIMYHFFSRKWLLVRYAVGFVAFPGGFGTLDEVFEVITLIQCNRMPQFPVILMGVDYWQPIVDWATNNALQEKLISKEELKIITVTDDVDEACGIICEKCKKGMPQKLFYSSKD